MRWAAQAAAGVVQGGAVASSFAGAVPSAVSAAHANLSPVQQVEAAPMFRCCQPLVTVRTASA
jgi:hypothetical protein